ncbi:MAG: DMT family transporter [Rhizobiaceae bacterium]
MTATDTAFAGAEARRRVTGILCIIGAAVMFSTNDVGVKWLSGDYPLHQVTFFRSLVALVITLAVIVPLDGGYRNLRTSRPGMHLMRGLIVVCANMAFFTGIASLSLADATAIYFVSPLFITAMSVVLLGETVGPRRWAAVLVGLIGVVLVIQPGGGTFQHAALLPLLAAAAYGLLQITTRKLGVSEKASTMAFYIQFIFLIFSSVVGLAFGDGRFAGSNNASIEFLFRAWIMPGPADLLVLCGVGITVSIGAFLISQGYRLCPAGIGAPFEYAALPLGITWSILIWGQMPDPLGWLGIVLIAGAGIYVFVRETMLGRRVQWKLPPRRGR